MNGPTLTLIDVDDPAHPLILAQTAIDGHIIKKVGDYLCVQNFADEVYVYRLVLN